MTPVRILLITSRAPDLERGPDLEILSNSEYHDRIIHTYPNIGNHEFVCLGIDSLKARDFSTDLETLSNIFAPDYIMVHTGIGLRRSPLKVIEAILNLSKKNPIIKVGFQRGKEAAIDCVISENVIGNEYQVMARRKALTILETEAVFAETTETRKFTEEIFFPHNF